LRLIPQKRSARILWLTVLSLLGGCIVVYTVLIGLQAYWAWRTSSILDRVERLRVGDPFEYFEAATRGCSSIARTSSGAECWLIAGAFRFNGPWRVLQKLPDSRYYDVLSLANRTGLRYWDLRLSASTSEWRITEISANLYVVGRYEALGARWTVASSVALPHDARLTDLDKRTYMNWYHITSMPSGEGFRVYATKESTDKELRARHINRGCLLSFRGCDGLCELLPDAIPVLMERHRSGGGCCSVPPSWCDLKNDDCRSNFGH
jgi:hypothetical protein